MSVLTENKPKFLIAIYPVSELLINIEDMHPKKLPINNESDRYGDVIWMSYMLTVEL